LTVRSAGRPTANLTAYDLYLRAYAMVWSSARQSPEALRLMEQAIEAIRITGPHSPGQRIAVIGCLLTTGANTGGRTL